MRQGTIAFCLGFLAGAKGLSLLMHVSYLVVITVFIVYIYLH